MPGRFDSLRADLQAELDEPGAITRAEITDLLDRHPSSARPEPTGRGDYSDADYDPAHYA